MSDFEASGISTSDKMETHENYVTITSSEQMKASKIGLRSESNDSLVITETKSTVEKYKVSGATHLSDAYRIRVAEGNFPLLSQENGDAAVNSSSSPLLSSFELDTNIAKMMNNICVIFLANKLNLSDSAKHSCMTLQPSYLRVRDGADVVSALEGILSHAIPNHSHFASSLVSSWESLRNSVFYNAKQEKTSIPLYAVVVLRMMFAVVVSYRQSTTAEGNDISGATVLAIGGTENSAFKTGVGQLASSSTIFECLVQLCSLPEIDQSLLLELSDAYACAGDHKTLSNEGAGLILPFHVLVQEIKSSVSKNPALSANDSVKSVVQKYIQQGSGNKSHEQSPSPATSTNKINSNLNDELNVSSQRETVTIDEPAIANEQVSRPTSGRRKKRKKKVRF